MKSKWKWSKYFFPLVFGLIIIVPGLSLLEAYEAADEPQKHEVSVSMVLLPVFAMDSSGKPVADLRHEDFQLLVNGEPANIAQFFNFSFLDETEVQEEVTVEKKIKRKKPVLPPSDRYVFVILDSVFNSHYGYRRAKKIARGIVENGGPTDYFVILGNDATGGLKHLMGPSRDKKELLQVVKKLKVPSGKWDKNLFLTRSLDAANNKYDMSNPFGKLFEENLLTKKHEDRMAYKRQVKHFSDALRRFKYALKTITKPKIVFLISEGISRRAFARDGALREENTGGGISIFRNPEESPQHFDLHLIDYLVKTVEAINHGGSVLYTVNPSKITGDFDASGEMSLRMMATEGGGAYIAGHKTKEIITRVKTSTSAYYELAFAPTPDMGANMDIQLRCKRDGIKVLTFNKTQKSFPYRWMDTTQKKLFALNLVTGGSWSRVLGKIGRGKYKKLGSTSTANGSTTVDVALPNQMRNKELDMFLISFDPVSKKTRVENFTRREKEMVHLELKGKKGRKKFFVIVEPRELYCLYNEVI